MLVAGVRRMTSADTFVAPTGCSRLAAAAVTVTGVIVWILIESRADESRAEVSTGVPCAEARIAGANMHKHAIKGDTRPPYLKSIGAPLGFDGRARTEPDAPEGAPHNQTKWSGGGPMDGG